MARRARSHRGLGSGHSGSGPGRPPGRRPARSRRARPPSRWASPTRMTSPRRASPLSQNLLGAEAGAGGLSSAWEGPRLRRGRLWGRETKPRGSGVRRCWRLVAPHIGRQTTHRARGRGRGYSEAGVRGSTRASPRAAGPPARGSGSRPPDPSPSGSGRGPCAPRSSARAEGRSEGGGSGGGVAAQRRPLGPNDAGGVSEHLMEEAAILGG